MLYIATDHQGANPKGMPICYVSNEEELIVTESYDVKDKLKKAGAKFEKSLDGLYTGWRFDGDFVESLAKVSKLGFDFFICLLPSSWDDLTSIIEELEDEGVKMKFLKPLRPNTLGWKESTKEEALK